jgi:hypothetical protein
MGLSLGFLSWRLRPAVRTGLLAAAVLAGAVGSGPYRTPDYWMTFIRVRVNVAT